MAELRQWLHASAAAAAVLWFLARLDAARRAGEHAEALEHITPVGGPHLTAAINELEGTCRRGSSSSSSSSGGVSEDAPALAAAAAVPSAEPCEGVAAASSGVGGNGVGSHVCRRQLAVGDLVAVVGRGAPVPGGAPPLTSLRGAPVAVLANRHTWRRVRIFGGVQGATGDEWAEAAWHLTPPASRDALPPPATGVPTLPLVVGAVQRAEAVRAAGGDVGPLLPGESALVSGGLPSLEPPRRSWAGLLEHYLSLTLVDERRHEQLVLPMGAAVAVVGRVTLTHDCRVMLDFDAGSSLGTFLLQADAVRTVAARLRARATSVDPLNVIIVTVAVWQTWRCLRSLFPGLPSLRAAVARGVRSATGYRIRSWEALGGGGGDAMPGPGHLHIDRPGHHGHHHTPPSAAAALQRRRSRGASGSSGSATAAGGAGDGGGGGGGGGGDDAGVASFASTVSPGAAVAAQGDVPAPDRLVECKVCYEHAVSTVLLPCRHMQLCKTCARRIVTDDARCPLCAAPVESYMELYTPWTDD